MKKKIIVLVFTVFSLTSFAQEKWDFMIVTYFPELNLIFVANNGAETTQEEIKAEKKDRLAGTPLLQKIKTFQNAGWEVISFNNVSGTSGKEFYCYLRKKQ